MAHLEIHGEQHSLETLELICSDGKAELRAGGEVELHCARLLMPELQHGVYEFEPGVSGEDPAGEFNLGPATYPIVGGTLKLLGVRDGVADIELEGLSEEVEFSGCDDVVRQIAFYLKGAARLG